MFGNKFLLPSNKYVNSLFRIKIFPLHQNSTNSSYIDGGKNTPCLNAINFRFETFYSFYIDSFFDKKTTIRDIFLRFSLKLTCIQGKLELLFIQTYVLSDSNLVFVHDCINNDDIVTILSSDLL